MNARGFKRSPLLIVDKFKFGGRMLNTASAIFTSILLAVYSSDKQKLPPFPKGVFLPMRRVT